MQGLAHQVHLFLVEYNKCSRQQLRHLPGYRPNNKSNNNNAASSGTESREADVPEDILHQQRALLQCCDRLKLTATLHQVR